MAQQNQGGEGILGAMRNYIPGMGTTQASGNDTNTKSQQGTGIFSYLPGFGGGSGNSSTGGMESNVSSQHQGFAGDFNSSQQQPGNQGGNVERESLEGQGNNAVNVRSNYKDNPRGDSFSFDSSSRRGTSSSRGSSIAGSQAAGEGMIDPSTHDTYKGPAGMGGYNTGLQSAGASGYDSSYQGAGAGSRYSAGRGDPNFAQQPGTQPGQTDYAGMGGSAGTMAQTSMPSTGYGNQGSGGFKDGQRQQFADDGVRGAPIEGDGVKGYAVSAPVGSGDTNFISQTGEPSGQVSGAHMQYLPDETDDRDETGRGTVGRTTGEGDSSFANVKRAIDNGTEHVVTKSSQSRIAHTSTTQL